MVEPEGQLSCDVQNCGQLASQFAFSPSGKVKTCVEHCLVLQNQALHPFNIALYPFIPSAEDGLLLESTKDSLKQQLEGVAYLEAQSETDLVQAQGQICSAEEAITDVVKRAFMEMRLRAQQVYEEIRKGLRTKREQLSKALVDQNCLLYSAEEECMEVPLFQVVLGDCKLQVAEALMACFCMLPCSRQLGDLARDQAERGHADMAAEVYKYAINKGVTVFADYQTAAAKRQRIAAKRLYRLLTATSTEQEAHIVADLYRQEGAKAVKVGNYQHARKMLQRSLVLLKQCNLESPALCLELGKVLSHFGKRGEAEEVLREGITYQVSPTAELAVQLATSLAEVHFQAGCWQFAIKTCEWIVQTYQKSEHHFELLRAYYFYDRSCVWVGDLTRRTWVAQIASECTVDNEDSEAVGLLIRARSLEIEGNYEEAVQCYVQGLEQGQQLFPNSYLVACSHQELGALYQRQFRPQQAIKQFWKACKICQIHFPQSQKYAQSLNCLGVLCKCSGKLERAEKCYVRAYQTYSSNFPQLLDFIPCIRNLEGLYLSTNRLDQAEKLLVDICQHFQNCSPESLNAAASLEALGLFYLRKGDDQQAAEKLAEAQQLYEMNGEQQKAATCRAAIPATLQV